MRFVLAAIFIALITFSGNAFAECFPHTVMKQALNQEGLFLHSYGVADNGFLFSIWRGKGHFVVLLEDETHSCIAMHGVDFHIVKEGRI